MKWASKEESHSVRTVSTDQWARCFQPKGSAGLREAGRGALPSNACLEELRTFKPHENRAQECCPAWSSVWTCSSHVVGEMLWDARIEVGYTRQRPPAWHGMGRRRGGQRGRNGERQAAWREAAAAGAPCRRDGRRWRRGRQRAAGGRGWRLWRVGPERGCSPRIRHCQQARAATFMSVTAQTKARPSGERRARCEHSWRELAAVRWWERGRAAVPGVARSPWPRERATQRRSRAALKSRGAPADAEVSPCRPSVSAVGLPRASARALWSAALPCAARPPLSERCLPQAAAALQGNAATYSPSGGPDPAPPGLPQCLPALPPAAAGTARAPCGMPPAGRREAAVGRSRTRRLPAAALHWGSDGERDSSRDPR